MIRAENWCGYSIRFIEQDGEWGAIHADIGDPTFDIFQGVSFIPDDIPNYVTGLRPNFSASAELTMECEIDGDLFAKLCGIDAAMGKDFTVEFESPVLTQVRRHKKKRINKKWAKRYGYKVVFEKRRLVDCTCKSVIDNDTLSIEGRGLLGI